MTGEQLTALKRYCHVDHDEDDALLVQLYAAAVEYLSNAGIPPLPTALYKLAAHALVLEWYDAEGISASVSVGVRAIINQLKLSAVGGCGCPNWTP